MSARTRVRQQLAEATEIAESVTATKVMLKPSDSYKGLMDSVNTQLLTWVQQALPRSAYQDGIGVVGSALNFSGKTKRNRPVKGYIRLDYNSLKGILVAKIHARLADESPIDYEVKMLGSWPAQKMVRTLAKQLKDGLKD